MIGKLAALEIEGYCLRSLGQPKDDKRLLIDPYSRQVSLRMTKKVVLYISCHFECKRRIYDFLFLLIILVLTLINKISTQLQVNMLTTHLTFHSE